MKTLQETLANQGRKQTWLADKIGVSAISVNMWCMGKRRISLRRKKEIEKLLGVSIKQNEIRS